MYDSVLMRAAEESRGRPQASLVRTRAAPVRSKMSGKKKDTPSTVLFAVRIYAGNMNSLPPETQIGSRILPAIFGFGGSLVWVLALVRGLAVVRYSNGKFSEWVMILSETLIELKCINSSFSSLSSYCT